jgi:ferredoxin-thioredoxin reductase catalytic subunit
LKEKKDLEQSNSEVTEKNKDLQETINKLNSLVNDLEEKCKTSEAEIKIRESDLKDKKEEATHRTWICACDEMQIYKYCHCLLFVTAEGLPITEYLPEDHVGRQSYGEVKDPTPDKGRPLRDKAEAREKERRDRKS